jgi:hypothetical protein
MTDAGWQRAWNAVRARVLELDPVALAAELVRIPSHPGIERQEEAVVAALERWFVAHEVAWRRSRGAGPAEPPRESRPTATDGASCSAATDTALNAADLGAGFGEIADGRLHGRGSST